MQFRSMTQGYVLRNTIKVLSMFALCTIVTHSSFVQSHMSGVFEWPWVFRYQLNQNFYSSAKPDVVYLPICLVGSTHAQLVGVLYELLLSPTVLGWGAVSAVSAVT